MALRHRRLHTTFYSDTLFSNVRSLTGSKCAQVTTDGLFTHIYPMASKSYAGTALHHFITDVGIPDTVIVNNAPEQTGTNLDFLKVCCQYKIQHRQTEPYTPRQNHAELSICEIKKKWQLRMQRQNVPRRLWDFGLVWVSEINNRTACGPQERTPYECITGNTPDISEWLDFNFYDWCWFWNAPVQDLTDVRADLGRFLGVAHRIGSDMCYWVLTDTGKVLARTTVQRITKDDMSAPTTLERMTSFTTKITERLDDKNHFISLPAEGLTLEDKEGDPNDEPEHMTQPERDDYTEEMYDAYLGAELMIPHGDSYISGRVTKRTRDKDGNPVGQ